MRPARRETRRRTAVTASRFELRTLGRVSLTALPAPTAGVAVTQPKQLALLSYLAVNGPVGSLRRDMLVAVFWPEYDDNRARRALRQALHGLRRALGPGVVITRGNSEVALDHERLWCDACAFTAASEANEFERTVELYGGAFLEGFHVRDVPDFENWASGVRRKFARMYMAGMERLAESDAAAGKHRQALERWRELAELQPLNSRIAMQLMQALEATGERGEALHTAAQHTVALRHAYGAEPDSGIQALAGRLRRGGE